MGCWNGTCMISNLPILSGEKIKLILLHKGYGSGRVSGMSSYVYNTDILKPAFLPIEGEYDDYGGIDSIVDDWNSEFVHNYLKSKISKIKCDGEVIEDYTLYDFTKGIERDGFEIFAKGNSFMASTMVSIYQKGYDNETLSDDKKAEYLKNLEILNSDEPTWISNEFSFVMIRKDVWDGIQEQHEGQFWNDDKEAVDENGKRIYYISCEEYHRRIFEKAKQHNKDLLSSALGRLGENLSLFGTNIFKERGETGDLWRDSASEYNQYYRKVETDEESLKIENDLVEFYKIKSFTSVCRIGWMVQPGAGSQSSEFKEYKILAKIVDDICDESMRLYEEDDD